jgi:hypothetical protein
MQRLRNARTLARLVLVWFALALGVAVAAPLIQPDTGTLVCSAGGVMKRVAADAGSDAAPQLPIWLDCPLCLQIAAPPPMASLQCTLAPAAARYCPGATPEVDAAPAVRLPGCGPPSHS